MLKRTTLAIALLVGLSSALVRADVKTQERTQIRFEGALGSVVNLFGGRAAREGIVSTVALKGSRMLTMNGADSGEIIDLAEEKVYTLNLKDKSYTVITFAEMRKRMQEAMAKAEKDAAAAKPQPEQPPRRVSRRRNTRSTSRSSPAPAPGRSPAATPRSRSRPSSSARRARRSRKPAGWSSNRTSG